MEGLMSGFFDSLEKLEKNNIPYMVVGSIASMIYGEPRMTHDMDVVIHLPPQDAQKFATMFPDDEYYCPPEEVIRAEIVHRGQFNLIHHESGLKIDIVIRKSTEFAATEFGRRRKAPFWNGHQVYIASPEDVIIAKLEYLRQGGSEKHTKDIRGILAETEVDQTYLDHWVQKLGLSPQWFMATNT